MLERREVFSAGPLVSSLGSLPIWLPGLGTPVGDKAAMIVPSGEAPVHFFLDSRSTALNDELGYYFVDGPDGRITKRVDDNPDGQPLLDNHGQAQYVRPGDADYARYALAVGNSATVFASGEVPNHGHSDKILDVLGDHYFGFYVVADASADDWRQSTPSQRPNVWFSVEGSSRDNYDHFRLTAPFSPAYRPGLQQYQVEDSRIASGSYLLPYLPSADFDDLVFSVNIVPFAYEDDYTVYNAGTNFNGAPKGFKIDTPDDSQNRGLGLLFNDHAFNGRNLTVTDLRLYTDDADWVSVGNPVTHAGKTTISDPYLHGVLTVYSSGGVAFQPTANDPYWQLEDGDPEPDPIYIQYRISDGVDTSEDGYIGIGHGYYHRGGAADNQHTGKNMYLLAGGGDGEPFDVGRTRFFKEGSNGKDIVLIAQGLENAEFADEVFDFFGGGTVRSVTSLNINTRDAANDPRVIKIIDGADALWFGGGAQSLYQSIWQGTALFAALSRAAASHVAIGGTSAGMAILGQQAYVDLPWDSVQSSFATQDPLDPRVHLMSQNFVGLPFAALSSTPGSPLYNIITDTHFTSRDRMPRLATFTARAAFRPLNGLGVDESTALLIEPTGADWKWTVYGEGHVYLIGPGTGVVTARYEDHQRLTYGPINVLRLDPGSSQRLSAIKSASPTYRFYVSKGTAFTTENGGQLY